MKEKKIFRSIQLFWAYFIGAGALMGGVMMWIDPSGTMWGMEPLLPILRRGLPLFETWFDNFIPSSIVLMMVVALPNMVSAYLTHRNNRLAPLSGAVCGLILMLWTVFEFYVWGFAAMSVIYLAFGLLQLLTSLKLMSYGGEEND